MRLTRTAAFGAAGLATALLLTACGGDDKAADKPAEKSGNKSAASGGASGEVAQVMQAVAKRTTEAGSAKVSMTMKMPGAMGGSMEMSGVMGWGPLAMDLTMKTDEQARAADSDMPATSRMLWVDNALYIKLDESAADDMDGKRWMKLDMNAALEGADATQRQSASNGLDNMNNQDPAKQVALLLSSPNVKHVGEEKVDGVTAQRYKGTLTVEEAMEANDSLEFLDKTERKQLVDNMKQSGIKDYKIDLWVNKDELPVRIDTRTNTPQGPVEVSQRLSDYGTKVGVKAPPADEVFDFLEMMKELERAGAGA
ncbi:hypothetical protein [Streptomyces alkaliterrae]|uniref:Lipoprotein n=1 Tax=Streptomyces alkaliterrae TaxID=2213162 RepID=A0A5P0YPU8_9ACTN|nr:hypothetical protein [Streptomyces alkaliterrae]MBB1253598.1 hypothetical protein [Streptomyces alkaliterrae]MBB1260941.1 hypothetical protein [Streptomyces alkaliterrae]MQS01617.1 hypothetical protein [Streptomyces alkaliterrae]